jgi:hypothetical protein
MEMWGASVVRLLWLGSRRNRGPVDGGGGKLLERSACWCPMCGGMEEWRSDGGNGAWFLPPTEEVKESGYCMKWSLLVVKGALVMVLEMALRLWTMVLTGVTVGMVR